jgi:predicted regulator of Ras-like GTPase activity (Roadblock/LC7/MglB family)
MSDVILFKEDIDRLNFILQTLADETKILLAVLVNKDTRLLAHHGSLTTIDMSALAALIVGSFSSTQAIAELIGESEFVTMTHCGKSKNLLISLVDNDTIIATIFDKVTTSAAVLAGIGRHTAMLKQALSAISHNADTLSQRPVTMPLLSQDEVEQGFDLFFEQPSPVPSPKVVQAPPPPAVSSAEAATPPKRKSPGKARRITSPPPPPETHYIQLEPTQTPQTVQPIEKLPVEEFLISPSPGTNSPHNDSNPALEINPSPGNSENLYFTSMNYLRNKAKQATTFQKKKPNKGVAARFFNRSQRNP